MPVERCHIEASCVGLRYLLLASAYMYGSRSLSIVTVSVYAL